MASQDQQAFQATAADALDLMTHVEHVPESWMEGIQDSARDLFSTSSASDAAGGAEFVGSLVGAACRVNANAHAMSSGGEAPWAFGLFPAVAILNHSCRPNATYMASSRPLAPSSSSSHEFRKPDVNSSSPSHLKPGGPCMTVRATQNIEPGEEITLQ